MTGVEIAVGCVAAWVWRKARRVGGRADAEVDAALDAAMDRVHQVVAAKLGGDPALGQLTAEAQASTGGEQVQVKDRTLTRVRLAIEEAADTDPVFAQALQQVLTDLQAAEQAAGTAGGIGSVTASGAGAVAAGQNPGIISTGQAAVNIQHR